jgi:hypothetical protein
MMDKAKYIGLNQKIQFDVLDSAIYYYLQNGQLIKEDLKPHIRQFIKGENRVDKTASYVMLIFKRQDKILKWLQSKVSHNEYIKFSDTDRHAITYCLVSLTFPIAHEILNMFASVFKVQDIINRESINHKMAEKYGSNRSLYNAMDSLIQMLMEQNKIIRVKVGLYSIGEILPVQNFIAKELIIYTEIKLSNSKSILADDIASGKFCSFFKVSYQKEMKFSLVKYSDSLIGGGYLGV